MGAYHRFGMKDDLCHVYRSVYQSLVVGGRIVRDVGDRRYLKI